MYDDLRPSCVLGKFVKEFTFPPDFECNDAFLDLTNYTDGCEPGEDICENMAWYLRVVIEEEREYQYDASTTAESAPVETEVAGGRVDEADDMSVCGDAGTGLDRTIAAAESVPQTRRGRKRKLHWKTEWLVYCFYAQCNMSMQRILRLFSIGTLLIHDIVYAWENVLCIFLGKFFPTPTTSQILGAHPKSAIKKFGHANIYLLLDTTEIMAEVESTKTVNTNFYSAYKHNSTVKWLAGCCPIRSM